MAALTVKSFPDDLDQRLHELAEREQSSLSQHCIRLLDRAVANTGPRSILTAPMANITVFPCERPSPSKITWPDGSGTSSRRLSAPVDSECPRAALDS